MSLCAEVVFASCQPTGTTEYMSSPARPRTRVAAAPMAKSDAARIRSAPPQSVAIQFTIRSPTGTMSARAISIAKNAKPVPIGAEYMFCIQARVPKTAIAAIERVAARWLKRGLRANVGRISEITPAAKSVTET